MKWFFKVITEIITEILFLEMGRDLVLRAMENLERYIHDPIIKNILV